MESDASTLDLKTKHRDENDRLRQENLRLKKDLQEVSELVNIAPAFFGFLSLKGVVIRTNDLALHVIEASSDQIQGKIFWECPWWKPLPESAKKVQEAVWAAAKGIGSEFDLEYLTITKGAGQKRWVALSVYPFESSSGEITRITVTGFDVTKRREAKQELSRAVAVSKIGFFDWDIPQNYLKFSKQMTKDWGFDQGPDFKGGGLQDALARIHPEDRDRVQDSINKSMEKGEPFRVECRVVRRDGRVIWIEAQGQVSYDENGKPVRFFGTSIDITDRKQAESDLSRTSGILNSIVNSSTDTIYLKDRKSRMIFANPETLKNIGATEEEIYGKNDMEFLGPGNGGEEILLADERIMSSGQGEIVEESVTWADRSRRIYMSSKQPHRDSFGKIIGLVGISRDITELKKNQSDLEEALRSRDTFLSIASHELKTPLTSLKLQSQMAKRTLLKYGPAAFTTERLEKLIDSSNTQADRLSRLVDDMLDISRIASGKLSMNYEKVDLSGLVGDTLSRFSQQFEEAGIDILKNLQPQIFAELDPFRFEQVLANLISNATKYAPGGQIHVTLQSDLNLATLRFRDHGPGIPENKHKTIFERFERLGNQVSGLGLGLNISREIVRAHGGDIEVQSQMGKGSEFIVTVPLEQPT